MGNIKASLHSRAIHQLALLLLLFITSHAIAQAIPKYLAPEAQKKASKFFNSIVKGDFSTAYEYTDGEVKYRLEGMDSNITITNKEAFIAISPKLFSRAFIDVLSNADNFTVSCCLSSRYFYRADGISVWFNSDGTPFVIVSEHTNDENNDSLADSAHPIDTKMKNCLDATSSFNQQKSCLSTANHQWDEELNKSYKALMSLLNKEQKVVVRDSQRKWIAYRDSQIKVINIIYAGYWETASLTRIMATMNLTREKALELRESSISRKQENY